MRRWIRKITHFVVLISLCILALSTACSGILSIWTAMEWELLSAEHCWVVCCVTHARMGIYCVWGRDAEALDCVRDVWHQPGAEGAVALAYGATGRRSCSLRDLEVEGIADISLWRCQVPLWLLFVVFAVYPIIVLVRGPVQRYERRTRGCCVTCGYDLQGCTTGRCPECGSVFERGRCQTRQDS